MMNVSTEWTYRQDDGVSTGVISVHKGGWECKMSAKQVLLTG